jgi:release factor glutamine methyltransferase
MKTVLEVITATTPFFQKNGLESPRLNIEHLLAHVLGKKRMDLYLEFDRPLSEQELEPLRDLVKRRAAGEPLQHLLGTVEFFGREFLSDKRALIPRPETEQLLELLLADCKSQIERGALLDVGTGSGVIALTLAAELPEAKVQAVDISSAALALAQANAEKLGLSERVSFSESDLLEAVTGPFDLIVANLPYIAPSAIPALAREVQHDPPLALNGGGALGEAIIFRLLEAAPAKLVPGGRLALEIGHDQADYFVAELEKRGYKSIHSRPDYQGIARFIFATYG